MQLVYLDEAGVSNKAHEPYLVVAGIIVNADKKWKKLERHFLTLAEELVPDYVPFYGRQFIFHAKDIWHGTGLFDRNKWPLKTRLKILERLAEVPAKFDLPIVIGYIDRLKHDKYCQERQPSIPQSRRDQWAHVEAFLSAAKRVEKWMQINASDEVAMMIAEDTENVKKIVDAVHSSYTDRSPQFEVKKGEVQVRMESSREKADSWWYKEKPFKSEYIVDAVHFAKKESSLLLQIADHCAFFSKRKLMKCKYISPFYDLIAPQVKLQPASGEGFIARVSITDISFRT